MNGVITTENVYEMKDELMAQIQAFSIKNAVKSVTVKEKEVFKAEEPKYDVVLPMTSATSSISEESL